MIKTFYEIFGGVVIDSLTIYNYRFREILKILTILEFMSTLIVCLKIQEIVC